MKVQKLLILLPLIIGPMQPATRAQTGRVDKRCAEEHLDVARGNFGSGDSLAEKELRLAAEGCGGDYPEAWLELSEFLSRHTRYKEAADALKRYIKLTPRLPHQEDFKDLRRILRAAELKERVDGSQTPPEQDLIELISHLRASGSLDPVRPYAKKLIQLYPDSIDAILVFADLTLPETKDLSRELINKAIQMEPRNVDVRIRSGWLYFLSLENFPQAEAEFRTALDLSRGQKSEAWYGLGYTLLHLDRKKESATAFRNYLRANKGSHHSRRVQDMITCLEQGKC